MPRCRVCSWHCMFETSMLVAEENTERSYLQDKLKMWLFSDRPWCQMRAYAQRLAMQASRSLFDAITAAARATARVQ